MSATKRESTEVTVSANTIILDIEGTTTSISFVKDVLFPYVRKHVEDFVKQNLNSDSFKPIVDALKSQAKEDEENKLEGVIAIPETAETDVLAKALVDNVLWQMDNDRKTKGLKDLQGAIYEEGYKKGDLKGHVYEDIEPCLKAWTEEGKSVYIYSSGSVQAQKLLYGHSEKGDLLTYIKGHFDTTVGMKGESQSYKKILEEISCSASEAVFLTDVPKEARAAKEVGILALLVSRDGNAALAEEDKSDFQVITSFDEIKFEQNSKKRKLSSDKDVIAETDNKKVESCSEPVSETPEVPKASNEEEKMDVDEDTVQKTTGTQNTDENKISEVASSKGEKEVMEGAKSEVASSENEKEVVEAAKSEVASSENKKEVVEAAKSEVASSENKKEVVVAAKSEVASSEKEKVEVAKSEVVSSESEKEVAKSEVATSKSEKEVVEAPKSDESLISSSDDSKQVKEETTDVCKPKENDSPTDSADSQIDTDKVESTVDSVEKEANKKTSKPDSTEDKATAVTDSTTDTDKVADSTEQIEIGDKTESEPTEKKTEPEKSSPLEVKEEVKESSTETEKVPAEVSKVASDEKVEVPKEDESKDSKEETKVEKDDKPSEETREDSKSDETVEKKEEKKEVVVAVNGKAKTNGASHDDKTPNGNLTNGEASPSEKTKTNGTHNEAVENGSEESEKSVKAGKLASSDSIPVEPVIES